jgi:5'-phosphate synthase pdxT subunit
MKIGVLALQGAFIEHIGVFQRLDVEAAPVYLPEELDGLDALVIPGGESTTISRLMEADLARPVRELATEGLPIMGTCAGLVLLAREITGDSVKSLGLMDIRVKRNAFGRQVDSFESDLQIPVLGEQPFHAVFIRAPIVEEVGSGVEILASLPDGPIVAVRQGKLVACAFHPELTDDLRFHQYFLDIVRSR